MHPVRRQGRRGGAARGGLLLPWRLLLLLGAALALLSGARGALGGEVRSFGGGDLEAPGVFEEALEARGVGGASGRELIIMCVGDTKDPRRVSKDPSLSHLAVDFAVSLTRNLADLGIRHYLLLASSEALCRRLQSEYGVEGCAWSSKWADHPGQAEWGVKHDEMFIMWAKQWHYVARALRAGRNVLRLDSDVFLGEDPYPLLHGPLLGRFNMVTQVDIFQHFTRPTCESSERAAPLTPEQAVEMVGEEVALRPAGDDLPVCRYSRLRIEMNIGMLYVRDASLDGPALQIVEGAVEEIIKRLDGPAKYKGKEKKLVAHDRLLDQPLFREMASRHVEKGLWYTSKGDGAPTYAQGGCPHAAEQCDAVSALRARTPVRYARLVAEGEGEGVELLAGAPDWLFGKACVKELLDAASLLRRYGGAVAQRKGASGGNSGAARRAMLAPAQTAAAPGTCGDDGWAHAPVMPMAGAAGHALVGVHMVYSMAPKRQLSMGVFGYLDVCPLSERAVHFANGSYSCVGKGVVLDEAQLARPCFDAADAEGAESSDARPDIGLVASHSFFRDLAPDEQILFCSAGTPPEGLGSCGCCATLPPVDTLPHAEFELLHLTPTGHAKFTVHDRIKELNRLPGCGASEPMSAWQSWWN